MTRGLFLAAVVVLLTACSAVRVGPDGSAQYRYSTFDFSGNSWAAQKQRCESLHMKPRHLSTDCGFWTCVSRYDCEAPSQSVSN
jgi:hypothetical protein